MTMFWIASLVLTLGMSLFVIIPLLKPRLEDQKTQRDELNKAFYKDRLAELDAEDDAGIIENKDELILDLKTSLLDDIPQEQNQAKAEAIAAAKFVIPSVIVIFALSYALYMKFGAMDEMKNWQASVDRLPTLANKYLTSTTEPLTQNEMEDLILGLRTKLYETPDQIEGWLFLGQIGLNVQSPELAVGAMKHAIKLAPTDKNVMLSYARALSMSDSPNDHNKSLEVLHKLLEYKDVDPSVYSLVAFNAFEQGDYQQAADYWTQMLDVVPKDDSRYNMIEKSIAMAKARLNGGEMTMPAHHGQAQAAQEPATQAKPDSSAEAVTQVETVTQAETAQTKPAEKIAEGTIQATITLDPKLKLPEQGFLIVSVHPASGAPMPLAAARYPLTDFPVTVTLDDSNGMMQGQKVSDLEEYVVKARIDQDGDVGTKDGDLFGVSSIIKKGDATSLTINQEYP